MPEWIDARYEPLRLDLRRIIQLLQQFTQKIGHADSGKILADLRDRLDEPYMFVIVGEVKAGKSSFINALLGDPSLCAVAPSPMTDSIQQILYGPEARTEVVSPYFKRLYQPNPILREIAIVDTPGTNTILEHHQEITERFVPGADLIVFVFEAKNPYRQSAWDFFRYLHAEWHKKTVFVLQQKDLLDASDLEINANGLWDQAVQQGVDKPVIFRVSAKDELEGRTTTSGFAGLRDFIRDHITGGQARRLKLEGMSDTLGRIVQRLQDAVDLRHRQYEADLAFRAEIRETLTHHGRLAEQQADLLIDSLMGRFDRIARKYGDELGASISFFPVLKRSIGSIFSKGQSLKAWLEDFTMRLRTEFGTGFQEKINDGVLDLAESIQQMVHHVDLQIRNSKTILSNDHEVFAAIAIRRQNVLRELREAFDQFVNHTENFTGRQLVNTDTQIGANVAASSGLAVVGIILAAVTQGMVFDVTGGVLTAVGFIVAGVSLGLQRGKVMRQYNREMDAGRQRLQDELHEALYAYIDRLKSLMDGQFARFDDLLKQEGDDLAELRQHLEAIRTDLHRFGQTLART